MAKKTPYPSLKLATCTDAKLRQRAEEALQMQCIDLKAVSQHEAQCMLHELLVRQLELEVQNGELRRVQHELEGARARYFDLFDTAPVGYLILSEQGLILEANRAACTLLGVVSGALARQLLLRYIVDGDADTYCLQNKHLFSTGEPQIYEMRMVGKNGAVFWAQIVARLSRDAENGVPVCRAVVSDITCRKQYEAQREQRITELQESMVAGRRLRGLLTICSSCKMIRNERGCWEQIEAFVRDHSEADFTHSFCPECMRKLYPQFAHAQREAQSIYESQSAVDSSF